MKPNLMVKRGQLVLILSVLLIALGAFFYFRNLQYQQQLNRDLYANEQKVNSLSELHALQLKAVVEKIGIQITPPANAKRGYENSKIQATVLMRKIKMQFAEDGLNLQVDTLLELVNKRFSNLDRQLEILKTHSPKEAGLLLAAYYPVSLQLANAWDASYSGKMEILTQRSNKINLKLESLAYQNDLGFIGLLLLTIGLLSWSFMSLRHQEYLKQQHESALHINSAVRASEREFSAAFEYASIGMSLVSLDGKFMRVNNSLTKILGYSAQELQAMNFQELTHPEDLNKDLNFVNQMLQGEIDSYSMQKRYFHKNKQILWINLSVSLVYHPNGKPKYFISQIENISDWKNAQQTLLENEIKYRSVFEHSLHAKLLHTEDGSILDANQAALDLFGYHQQELMGTSISLLVDYKDSRIKELLQALNELGQAQGELTGVRKNGQQFPVLLSSVKYRNKEGQLISSCSIVDLTIQKNNENELLMQQQRIGNILEGTNAGTWEWNVQTGETRYNDVWAELIGYSLSELQPISMGTWETFIHPDDLEESNRRLNDCFTGEAELYECECRMKHRDGHYIWVLDRGKVLSWTEDGKPLWMFGTHLDITASKEMEFQLRQQKVFTEAVLETINVGVVVCDKEGKLTLFNKATREMHGIPESDIPAQEWASHYQLLQADRVTPLHTEQIPLYKAWKGIDSGSSEMSIRHQSGAVIDVLATGTQVTDSAGLAMGAVVAMTDVTKIRAIQELLERSEAKFRGIFNATFQFIGFLDVNGLLLEINKTALEFAGIQSHEVIGKVFWDCHLWKHSVTTQQLLQQNIEKASRGEAITYEVDVLDRNNQSITILFSLKPLIGNNNEVVAIIAEGRPIQEMVDARHQLEQKNEELERFAATAAHDLKEPLRMIGSFMSLLKSKYGYQLDETAIKYVDFAINGSSRMSQLISDLLDYAKIGSERVAFESIDFELLLLDMLSLNDSFITERQATVRWQSIPTIRAQKVPLQMLLQNLVINAIKYQDGNRKPEISIEMEEQPDYWLFSVRDNGIGIAPENAEKIFQVFSRLHAKDKYGGVGMGLATCKKIVELHGGKIWVEANEPVGSCFRFTINKSISV